jgi:polysaccharide pyruvyl transferase WcaK-like protein
LYLGGQGDDNLGDEVMLETARRLLPESELVSFAYAGQEQKLALCGLSGSRFFDSAILGGGTLINPHWVESVRTALRMGLRVWTLGTGVGSSGFGHSPEVDITEWKGILNDLDAIGVRGPLSKARLTELGVETHVEVVGDLALGLALDEPKPLADPPRFAVNITLPAGNSNGAGYEQATTELKSVAREFVNNGWKLIPIAMHRDDVGPLEAFVGQVLPKRTPVRTPQTAKAFFAEVGPCTFLIGVRLHSAVLSCCAGVPPVMLGYRDKCLDFMQSMDLCDLHVDLAARGCGEIEEKVRFAAGKPVAYRETVILRALKWKTQLEAYVDRHRSSNRKR